MSTSAAVCPHCKVKLKVATEARRKQIACPKCSKSFVPADSDVVCVQCKAVLPAGSVFCVKCGFDFRTKTTLSGTFEKAKKDVRKVEERGAALYKPEDLDVPTWAEILATPLNVEMVFAESIILTMWGLAW